MLGRLFLTTMLISIVGAPALAQMSDAEFTKLMQARTDRFSDAINRHDVAAVAAFYTENATRLSPYGIQHGRAEIAKAFENGFKNNNVRDFAASVEQAHENGNEAWGFGSTTLTISVPGNEALHVKLLWTHVLERQGDEWKSRIDIYNLQQPPPKPAQ